MIDNEQKIRLAQIMTTAVVEKHLYQQRLAVARWKSRAVDFLALSTPTLYFALRFTAKGTSAQAAVEICWEFLAAVLLALTILKLVFRWDDYVASYLEQLGANTRLANQAQNLLDRAALTARQEYEHFIAEAGQLEKEDRAVLGHVFQREEQRAYREALKELDPTGAARCPECGVSARAPFRRGACPACGSASNQKEAAYATS